MSEIRNIGNMRTASRFNALFFIIGWISAIISIVRLPFIFGVIGVIMGIICSKNGSRAALALIVTSIVFMAAGLIFNEVIYNYLRHFIGI